MGNDKELKGSVKKCESTVKEQYRVSLENVEIKPEIAATMAEFGYDATAASTLIGELEAARAEYLREKGESQDATKAKDAAFAKMDDWMSEFYAVAKIGLLKK